MLAGEQSGDGIDDVLPIARELNSYMARLKSGEMLPEASQIPQETALRR